MFTSIALALDGFNSARIAAIDDKHEMFYKCTVGSCFDQEG